MVQVSPKMGNLLSTVASRPTRAGGKAPYPPPAGGGLRMLRGFMVSVKKNSSLKNILQI